MAYEDGPPRLPGTQDGKASTCLGHRAFKPSNNAQAFVPLVLSRHTMEGEAHREQGNAPQGLTALLHHTRRLVDWLHGEDVRLDA